MNTNEIIEKAIVLAEDEKGEAGPLSGLAYDKGADLARKLNANVEIVKLGLLFMDIKRNKAMAENREGDHIKMGVEAAKEFFQGMDVDEEIRNKVINCIEAHHGDVPFNCIEAEIVRNADCYKFLHPKGSLFYIGLLKERFGSFEKALDVAEAKLEEKHNLLTLDIVKGELEPCYKMLKEVMIKARE